MYRGNFEQAISRKQILSLPTAPPLKLTSACHYFSFKKLGGYSCISCITCSLTLAFINFHLLLGVLDLLHLRLHWAQLLNALCLFFLTWSELTPYGDPFIKAGLSLLSLRSILSHIPFQPLLLQPMVKWIPVTLSLNYAYEITLWVNLRILPIRYEKQLTLFHSTGWPKLPLSPTTNTQTLKKPGFTR